MKVENINLNPLTTENQKPKNVEKIARDFTKAFNLKDNYNQGIEIPNNSSKEMIKNFAEWYFKQGQIYEKTKSYMQAISAYEKANSVEPDIKKATSIEEARNKAYQK
ncbi:MAG: hypothetical protein ACP5QT_01370 [Brevinematia bacterium]